MQRTSTSLTRAIAAYLLAIVPVVATVATAQEPASAAPAAKPATAAASSAKAAKTSSSVIVLDQLLKADNDAALAALHKSSLLPGTPAGANPGSAMPRGPVERPPTSIRVTAIYGDSGTHKANVVVNGVPSVATPNAVLGECRVVSIADRCVVLKPVKEKEKASRCPAACWTGESAYTPPQTLGGLPLPSAPLPGAPLPRY